MFDINLLNNLIYDRDIQDIIYNKCENQFKISFEIQSFVNSKVLSSTSMNLDNNLDLSIKLLFTQCVHTYKSCISLVQNGYVPNSLINLRNLVEITFNINYILSDTDVRIDRSKSYLDNKHSTKLSEKSLIALDKNLYKFYKHLCEYSHGNFSATINNLENNLLSTYPTSKFSYEVINLINSIYIYCIKSVCTIFDINTTELDAIDKPESMNNILLDLNFEKYTINLFKDVLSKLIDDPDSDSKANEFIRGFNTYRINKKNHRKKKITK